MLKNEPSYARWFEMSCRDIAVLQELHEAYMKQSGTLVQFNELSVLMVALEKLCLKPSEAANLSRADILVRYHQANQLLTDLKKPQKLNSLVTWLEGRVQKFYTEHSEELDIASELENNAHNKLYSPLITSIFSYHLFDRIPADTEINSIVEQSAFEELPFDGFVGLLLHRWVLDHLMSESHDNSITANEGKLLHTLFVKYLSDPEQRAMWRRHYSLSFMETALLQFNQNQNISAKYAIQQPITEARGADEYELWQNVISCYARFKKHLQQHTPLQPDTEAYRQAEALIGAAQDALRDKAAVAVDAEDTTTHLGIARACHQEMCQMLMQRL